MTITEKDELLAKIDTLFYTSFLLRFLDSCGQVMDTTGYNQTILKETRWYVLENQLDVLTELNKYVSKKDCITEKETL